MAQIRWTEEAVRWLRDIHDYIAVDNPGAAANVVTSIYKRSQLLGEQPEIGHKYQTVSGREVRILQGRYRITCLIKKCYASKQVEPNERVANAHRQAGRPHAIGSSAG